MMARFVWKLLTYPRTAPPAITFLSLFSGLLTFATPFYTLQYIADAIHRYPPDLDSNLSIKCGIHSAQSTPQVSQRIASCLAL